MYIKNLYMEADILKVKLKRVKYKSEVDDKKKQLHCKISRNEWIIKYFGGFNKLKTSFQNDKTST